MAYFTPDNPSIVIDKAFDVIGTISQNKLAQHAFLSSVSLVPIYYGAYASLQPKVLSPNSSKAGKPRGAKVALASIVQRDLRSVLHIIISSRIAYMIYRFIARSEKLKFAVLPLVVAGNARAVARTISYLVEKVMALLPLDLISQWQKKLCLDEIADYLPTQLMKQVKINKLAGYGMAMYLAWSGRLSRRSGAMFSICLGMARIFTRTAYPVVRRNHTIGHLVEAGQDVYLANSSIPAFDTVQTLQTTGADSQTSEVVVDTVLDEMRGNSAAEGSVGNEHHSAIDDELEQLNASDEVCPVDGTEANVTLDPIGDAIAELRADARRIFDLWVDRVTRSASCMTSAGVRDAVVPGAFIAHALKYDYVNAVKSAAKSDVAMFPAIEDSFDTPFFYAAFAGYAAGLAGTTKRLLPALALVPAASLATTLAYAGFQGQLEQFLKFNDAEPIAIEI